MAYVSRTLSSLVDTRRACVLKQQTSSGLQETYGEYKKFIDDLISSIDDKKEKTAKEKNSEEKKKQKLRSTGESEWESAFDLIANSGTNNDEDDTSRKKAKTVREAVDCVEDKKLELMKRRLDLDELRLASEKERVSIQGKHSEALF